MKSEFRFQKLVTNWRFFLAHSYLVFSYNFDSADDDGDDDNDILDVRGGGPHSETNGKEQERS